MGATSLIVAISGFVIMLLSRRRKRLAAACTQVRPLVEELQQLSLAGTHFRGHGVFSTAGGSVRDKIAKVLPLVIDERLRTALERILWSYGAAEKVAMPGPNLTDPDWNVNTVLTLAAMKLDATHPTHWLAASLSGAADRLAALERRAAGL